jgi:hypothetical protein
VEQVSRVDLGAPVWTPRGAVAALCRVTLRAGPRVDARGFRGRATALLGGGEKVPLALLLLVGREVRCLRPDGRPMPVAEAEALLPGCLAAFRAAAAGARAGPPD